MVRWDGGARGADSGDDLMTVRCGKTRGGREESEREDAGSDQTGEGTSRSFSDFPTVRTGK